MLRGGGDELAPHPAVDRLLRWRSQRVGDAPPSSPVGGGGVGDVLPSSPEGGGGGVRRASLAWRVARVAGVSRGGGADGASPGGEDGASPPRRTVLENEFLEFVAPGKVEVRREELHEEAAVGEGQVLVEAICSSISSGTELKVRVGAGTGGNTRGRGCTHVRHGRGGSGGGGGGRAGGRGWQGGGGAGEGAGGGGSGGRS